MKKASKDCQLALIDLNTSCKAAVMGERDRHRNRREVNVLLGPAWAEVRMLCCVKLLCRVLSRPGRLRAVSGDGASPAPLWGWCWGTMVRVLFLVPGDRAETVTQSLSYSDNEL